MVPIMRRGATPRGANGDASHVGCADLVATRTGGVDADGVVSSPWGRFPVRDGGLSGEVAVLVPPDAVSAAAGAVAPDGAALDGIVTGRVFRGGSAFAVVEGESWPPLDVRADPAWRVGDTVRLSVDASAVHVMRH